MICWQWLRTAAWAAALAMGTAGAEAWAEPGCPPNVNHEPGRQTGTQSPDVVLARGKAVGHFLWLQAGRPGCSQGGRRGRHCGGRGGAEGLSE